MAGIQFPRQHILTVEKKHVVLRVDAMAAEPAGSGNGFGKVASTS
jgi:hypothetical protein